MAHLQVIPESRVDGDVKRIFEEIRREKRLPFVPNFFKTLAHAPQSLEATWMAYRGITTRGSLPEALKEMIFVAISVARNCKYCEAAHLAFCNLLRVEADDLVALTANIDVLRPERTRDIINGHLDIESSSIGTTLRVSLPLTCTDPPMQGENPSRSTCAA